MQRESVLHLFLWLSIFDCMARLCFVYPFIWDKFGLFPHLGNYEYYYEDLCTRVCGDVFSVSLDVCCGVELLDHESNILRKCQTVVMAAAPFDTPLPQPCPGTLELW